MKSWKPQPYNEAEELFKSDVMEKKKESNSRMVALKHKRVGKGNMMFPTDFMSRAERLEHTKAGAVMTTNLFDEVITLEEFNNLEREEKRNRMIHWRSKYSNKHIQQILKLSNTAYYKIVDELQLPKAPRVETASRKGTTKKAAPKKSLLELAEEVAEQIKAPVASVTPVATPVQEVLIDGLHLVFRGTYTPEQIQKQLAKVELLLDGEDDSYYIEMKLMQKKQPVKK